MQVRKICQWCGKPFIAQKTTTCYCSHQCSNLGYKERIRERRRQLKRAQELLQPRQAAEGQDFFSFAQAAKLMGVTRQYIYKLVKESKLRASRLSGKKSLIRRADIELMMKTKPYERIMPKEDFDITEYYTAEEMVGKKVVVVANLKPAKLAGVMSEGMLLCAEDAEGKPVLLTAEKDVPNGVSIG